MKRLAGYFLRGLAVLLPTGLTVFLIYYAISRVDAWVNRWVETPVPGVGVVVVLVAITLTGILFSGVLGRAFLNLLDEVMSRTPLVKLIYSSVKDLIDAFVGEKKKFTEAVLIELTPGGVAIIGFITRHDLSMLDQKDRVAVYFPYSYAFTGHLLLVPVSQIKPLDAPPGDIMKFIVSGGITGLEKTNDQ